jgi:hypothetical protein
MLEPPTQCRGAPAVEARRCWNAWPVKGCLMLGPWTARRLTPPMLHRGTARLRRVLNSACCFGKPHPNRMAHHPDGQQALRDAIRQAMRNR